VAGVILAQLTVSLGCHTLPSENAFKIIMAFGAGAALIAVLLAAFLPQRQPAATVTTTR
jgi:hypothetical protein